MSILGFNDLKQFALPAGWDGDELMKYALKDGTTMDVVLNDLVAACIAAGNAMVSDPFYGSLVHFTTELGKEYGLGDSGPGFQRRSEYTQADPGRVGTTGHMFPLHGYDRTLGFTADFLDKARMTQINANVTRVLRDAINNYQQQVLTRFFSSTEVTLGSSGKDVPFASGSGLAFTPETYDGQTFASTHTHFAREADSGAGRLAAAKAGAAHLMEHGHMGPWVGIIPYVDRADWTAVTGFYKPERSTLTQYPSTEGRSNVSPDEFIGVLEVDDGEILLKTTHRLPANYFGLYKTYGTNDPMNPLAVRYDERKGLSPFVKAMQAYAFPLTGAVIWHDFGVGVNDRVGGFAAYFDASGSYVSPTIN